MALARVPEPELMDSATEADDYDRMDFRAVNDRFVQDAHTFLGAVRALLDVGTGTGRIPLAYLAHARPSAEEREAIVGGVERIALELASRFCRDVFEDSYFGWSAARFPSRRAHNLFRARGQLSLAVSVRDQRAAAERAVRG